MASLMVVTRRYSHQTAATSVTRRILSRAFPSPTILCLPYIRLRWIHFSSSSIFDFGGFRKNLCCLCALSFINIGQSILQIRLEIRFSLHWPEPFGYPLKEITAINMFLMAFKVKPCSWRSQNSWWWSWTWHWKSWDHRLLIAIVLLLPTH